MRIQRAITTPANTHHDLNIKKIPNLLQHGQAMQVNSNSTAIVVLKKKKFAFSSDIEL